MAKYIAQVTFQFQTGLPRDVAENTFHFTDGGDEEGHLATAEQICQRLSDFYTGTSGTEAGSLGAYMSAEVKDVATIKVYDFTVPTPRPIFYEDSFTLVGDRVGAAPPQVALCLSYYSLRNVKRQRGRIYFGPFSAQPLTSSGSMSVPGNNVMNALVIAGQRLAHTSSNVAQGSTTKLPATPATGPLSAIWSIYSRVANTWLQVTDGWVDNEWDSQYRRRIAATTRQSFTGDVIPSDPHPA